MVLSPASLCLLETKRVTRGRHDSTKRIPVGVAEKPVVVNLWTWCQKVLRRAIVPALDVNRSAP